MRKFLVAIAFLLLLVGVGCKSNTTYSFPIQETKFEVRKPDEEDQKIFNESYISFSNSLLEILDTTGEHDAIPVISTYQGLLTLLGASEGDTYNQVAHVLRTTSPDEYSLVQAFNHLIEPYVTSDQIGIQFGSSIWLVWPIVLEIDFQQESAKKIRTDVVRLGSFGLTAQRALQTWIHQYDSVAVAPNFDRSDPIISLGAFSSQIKVHFQKHEFNDSHLFVGLCSKSNVQTDTFYMIAWDTDTEFKFPISSEVLKKIDLNQKGPDGSTHSEKIIQQERSLLELVNGDYTKAVTTGPNDFRNLSVEIIPQGDPIGITIMDQYTNVKLSITGDDPFMKPMKYAIIDSKSNFPLLLGVTGKTK